MNHVKKYVLKVVYCKLTVGQKVYKTSTFYIYIILNIINAFLRNISLNSSKKILDIG